MVDFMQISSFSQKKKLNSLKMLSDAFPRLEGTYEKNEMKAENIIQLNNTCQEFSLLFCF